MAKGVWRRVAEVFVQRAEHTTVAFLPDPDGEPLYPDQGDVRLWLAEGFLASSRTWGNDHFPAMHDGVALKFGGQEGTGFATFTRAPDVVRAPGERLNYPISPLLPYSGGVLEVEAALYQASNQGPLATAVRLAGAIAPLIGPPLSAAAAIADRVSTGLDTVFEASGNQPVLVLHQAWTAPGQGGPQLRPGTLVVLDATPGKLDELSLVEGLLHVGAGANRRRPAGVDYLAVRLECRREHDSWRMPHLDALIRSADLAYLQGQTETFKAQRTEAIAAAWTSTDLIPADRHRVAFLVAAELDRVKELGAVPTFVHRSLEDASASLPARDAPELRHVTLADLLA